MASAIESRRRFRKTLFLWAGCYIALVWIVAELFDRHSISGEPLRVAVALVPIIPSFGMLLTLMKSHREQDELQRRITAEGIMFAFGATAIVTFSYGFLEQYAYAPKLSYFFVWAVLAITWMIGSLLARYRYR
jgi:hypothetical protein